MKFMKLGSKPDSFQTDGNNVRYVVSELAKDITVIVGDVKFYLHKFPLLSKSAHLQKLVTAAAGEPNDEVYIPEIPGGSAAFEICAKFCYGMTVTVNAYNVVAARCAAEYLGMHETIEKGNLAYKIDIFLSSSIFRSWKDSIIVLQTTKALMPLSEELKLVSNCLESIAMKASADVSNVDWSYTYNRNKLLEENDNNPNRNGVRNRSVPKDWWVEDLCELEIDVYMRVIASIKSKGIVLNDVIGEALKAYAYRYLPGFSKSVLRCGDLLKYQSAVATIVWMLPSEKGSVSSSFLSKLLKASIFLASGDETKDELVRLMGQQLEEATVSDLLLRAPDGEATTYDVDAVQKMVEIFLLQDHNTEIESLEAGNELEEPRDSCSQRRSYSHSQKLRALSLSLSLSLSLFRLSQALTLENFENPKFPNPSLIKEKPLIMESLPSGYRPNVGVCLINSDSQVFVASRLNVPGAWQMPQGGIEDGEDLKLAAVRELKKETGVVSAEIVAEVPKWLTYDFPSAVKTKVNRLWGGQWHGQAQKWFLMRMTKDDSEINLDNDEADVEFAEWKWASPEEVIEQAVDYKRPTYEEVMKTFAAYLDGNKISTKCKSSKW